MNGDDQRGRTATVGARRSVRMRAYDYSGSGAYFFTVVAADRRSIFGDVTDGTMELNACGRAVVDEWQRSAELRPSLTLDEFVVMPNHVHGIVWLDKSGDDINRELKRGFGMIGNRSLSSFLRAFKAACTSRINGIRQTPGAALWQRNYFEHVVRNERELETIRRYIIENPQRWPTDAENPERQEVARRL